MNCHPVLSPSGLNRRTILGHAVAVGAALGLGGGRHRAAAQDATPAATPAYAAGVTPEILGRIEPPAAPGYVLQLVRVTPRHNILDTCVQSGVADVLSLRRLLPLQSS